MSRLDDRPDDAPLVCASREKVAFHIRALHKDTFPVGCDQCQSVVEIGCGHRVPLSNKSSTTSQNWVSTYLWGLGLGPLDSLPWSQVFFPYVLVARIFDRELLCATPLVGTSAIFIFQIFLEPRRQWWWCQCEPKGSQKELNASFRSRANSPCCFSTTLSVATVDGYLSVLPNRIRCRKKGICT